MLPRSKQQRVLDALQNLRRVWAARDGDAVNRRSSQGAVAKPSEQVAQYNASLIAGNLELRFGEIALPLNLRASSRSLSTKTTR